ncbi:hypothetical protein HGO40_23810 [Pseudomonas sp. CG7]|uniref:hypothetical protein n=1 Tax=Pseudomonas sp. CG7 TaxID=191007 RepID=UPI002033786A|nr:hypothetical protein [Pseudomonas sp. CG7]MCM2463458.1 hypothetical protein [Pseudomonas sp. CG7]
MGFFFEPYQADRCCLCGSAESLTGEHKVKASALRKIFGEDAMAIGSFDGTSSPRSAQGPKSRAFHFSARICAPCNGSHTQGPDHEFDRFHASISEMLSQGKAPELVFSLPKYEVGSVRYLDVFRYFAKLLCCQVAESRGPRPLELSAFAVGKTDRNLVFLNIDADPTYEDFLSRFGEHQFAGHGGLMVCADSESRVPTSFRSSLSLGTVRYKFWVQYDAAVQAELQQFHPDFWGKCEVAYREAIKVPLSDDD